MADKIEDEELDPIVKAALLPDPDDEPSEGKDNKKPETEEPKKSEKTEGDEADKTENKENEQKPEADKGKEDPNKEVPKAETKKPEGEEGKSTDEQRQSRKERREERKQRFIEKIRRENQDNSRKAEPEKSEKTEPYKPLEYEEGQYDAKELKEDRDKYGEAKTREGREAERKIAEQEKFWSTLEYEAKLLAFDPKYAFLDENSPSFDEDRAANINEMYLELVGFDPKTKAVSRVDLSYEKFAKTYVDQMEDWAEERQAETVKNLAAQASTTGIRPSGSASTGLKKLKPGDISRMSQEEYEKNEAEIDRQIMAELGM